MCILCVIQKWSRRVATMLPWLVIPLIGLWALSQILPPAFRFEITSPRLACVFVLLITLFWYEILMPQLSAWRVRRNARMRERKRFEAIELHKLRKTATRRCRNCLTAYRDQNPGGGRFMCSCCGHISKRPVLDLPLPAGGLGISNSGVIKELVGKHGKILNGKGWSENGWMCRQDWLENGNWVSGSIAGKSNYWQKNGSGIFGGDENCLAEKSYSGAVIFTCKLLTSFFVSIRWLLRKIFRISSSGEDSSSDGDHSRMMAEKGENGSNYHKSRGEKARRKAEEKRQARLEKELLEEEERKQREEVARLVEERRRLRDEKMEAEKEHGKTSPSVKEKDSKREAERKRQERRKERDKGSSKSNSDAEELDKRAGKENERKRDFDKKSDNDRREHQKIGADIVKSHGMETLNGGKTSASNHTQGNAGTRYLDRMKGTFLSSSRAFSGGGFFGNGANNPVTTAKENKSVSSDHLHTSAHKRDFYPSDHTGKLIHGDDKSINRPVLAEPQPRTTTKKSWQQLFTRSSLVPATSNTNVISRPNPKLPTEVQSPPLPAQSSAMQTFDNPINFGLPSPFILSAYPSGSTSTSLGFSPAIEPILPHVGDGPHEFMPEETELFEDPCYVPDPISLLGPVSESLDNFQLDLGPGFAKDIGSERSHTLKNASSAFEVSKPAPIESPLSRLRVADEKHNNSNWFPSTSKVQDVHTYPVDDTNANGKGTWQMWNSSPLGQDGLGLVGGPPSWILPPELNRSNKEDFVHPASLKTVVSPFTTEDPVLSGTQSPKVFLGSSQNGGAFSPVTGSNDHDPWLQNAFFPPLSVNDHLSLTAQEDSTQNEMIYGSLSGSATNHSFDQSPANCWPKEDWTMQTSGETVGKPLVSRPHFGGIFPNTGVQSLWSFE
ncbi:stress response protein nst1-like [Mangifera indica]|uniref:stress response protein nst1-like n=1 Tax=Mangifera indica TaxID=29780 RepID=UPI001CFBD2BD|nr:stress response protein nst1-like [Mangifera indica]